MHCTDSPRRADYPKPVFQHRSKGNKCSVCGMLDAAWVTRNDQLAPESPCFFCEDCFLKLHYDSQGSKLCQFTAHPFHPKMVG